MAAQTAVTLDPVVAVPGQLADSGPYVIRSYVASEAIPAGVAVEVDTSTNMIRLPKSTTTGFGPLAGVTKYTDVKMPATIGGTAGYAAGDIVPVVRKGRVYASFNGGSETALSTPNVKHASDDTASNAQYRGYFTGSATSSAVGAEVAAAPAGVLTDHVVGVSGLTCVELNLP